MRKISDNARTRVLMWNDRSVLILTSHLYTQAYQNLRKQSGAKEMIIRKDFSSLLCSMLAPW